MGCQEQPWSAESAERLAFDAVQRRIQALKEYLAVYRVGARGRGQRRHNVGELRHDIRRLQAWAWYLDAMARHPWWWRALSVLGAGLGGRRRGEAGRRRQQRPGMQHLSAFSVVDRAYAARMEEVQGGLLTLDLRRDGGDAACRRRLTGQVARLEWLRDGLAERAGRVAIICTVLGGVQRCGSWFGLHPGATQVTDP